MESSDYKERVKLVEEFNAKNRWKKRGIALTATKHHVGFSDIFMNQGAALVMVYRDGSVSLNHGGTELGQGSYKCIVFTSILPSRLFTLSYVVGLHTKMIQVATRALQVPVSKIYFSETASDKVPNAVATCGSMTSDLCGMAVLVSTTH